VDDMTPHDKHATLLVDEMKITPGYQYDISFKEVLGLCTMPNATGEHEEHAEIALVPAGASYTRTREIATSN
jgi:hypothetical protein